MMNAFLFFCLGGAPFNNTAAHRHRQRQTSSSLSDPPSPSTFSDTSSLPPPDYDSSDNDGYVLDAAAAKSFQTLYFNRENEITPRPFSSPWVARTAKVSRCPHGLGDAEENKRLIFYGL